MKYFAVAVIFGLFALSQAMPVEESEEKRFIPGIIDLGINGAKFACQVLGNNPDKLIQKACGCFNALTGGGLPFGDESEVQQKRFFLPTPKQMIDIIKKVATDLCSNPAPELAGFCQCSPHDILP